MHNNGEVTACGKGSYGRLGLGDSEDQPTLKRVMFDSRIKKISSSKGSDGHSLALSEDGNVYSWGDGMYIVLFLYHFCLHVFRKYRFGH